MARIWDFPKLKGQENYQPWSKSMKSALRYSRLWEIVERGLEIYPAELPEERSHVERANEEHPEDRVVIDQAGPTEAQTRQFSADHDHWMDLNSQTMELIYTMCEDKPREYIEDEEFAQDRWTKLENHYQSSGFTLRFTKYKEFIHTTMANSDNSIESYCTNLRSRSRELKKMNAPISEWLMVAVLLDNLGEKYSSFVHRIVASRDEVPEFDKVVTMLYEEDRLLKSDKHNIAMAAAAKNKGNGNSNGKGNNRGGSNSRGGRGGQNDGNTNTGDRHSKNPRSTNYKGDGDPPECDKCSTNAKGNLKKHWPYDCWTLHEDRIPEKYRNNNKPKANKATEKDDFVDANSTHFSAMAMEELPRNTSMAMSARLMQGMEGDDEYWGWSIDETAPKMGGEVVTEQPNIQSLEQSLTENGQLMEIRGNTENMSNTGPDLLSPGTNLGREVSRGAHGMLTSLQISPAPSPTISHQAYAAKYDLPSHRSPDWLIDSGSTNHMYHDKEEFTEYQSHRAAIIIANGSTVWAQGRGIVQHEWITNKGSHHIVNIDDVLHVPDLTCGLFSLNQATRNGLRISFSGEDCHIYKGRKIIGSAPKINNIYILMVSQPTAKITMLIQENRRALATNVMYNDEAVELWHRRMGHLNEADLKRLVTMSNGIVLNQKPHVKALCEACQKAKSKRKVSRRIQRETWEKLGKIHMDLGGPYNVASYNGARYYMLLTDQATLRTWCYTYKHKDETFQLFKDWKTMVENESDCKIKGVRVDNGTEFINQQFNDLFKATGIMWEPSVPYTPEQNGLSEVQNRTVMSGVRVMLFDSKLSRYLWSELLHTKVYQKNRSPTTRLQMTPHEAWTNEKPSLAHMRMIGCIAWVHIPKEKRKKLDERSQKCFLIGYESTNIFRVWNPATKRVERVSHVDFDESPLMASATTDTGYWLSEATGDDPTGGSDAGEDVVEHPKPPVHHHVATDHAPIVEHKSEEVFSDGEPRDARDVGEEIIHQEPEEEVEQEMVLPSGPDTHPDPCTDSTLTSLPKRVSKPSQKALDNQKWSDKNMWAQRAIAHTKCTASLEAEQLYCRQATLSHEDPHYHDFEPEFDLDTALQHLIAMRSESAQANMDMDDVEPLTYEQAIAGPNAHHWKEAMDKQMASFKTMNTWKLVPYPKDAPVLSGKWVYKIKKKVDKSILYKARWVVRGFEQIHGVNYDQTFASVVKSMSFKALFAIMAYYDLECEQMDVITAFLNALLKETIYVEQPTGYATGNSVCLLLRALYGLKQSPREWYYTLRDFLESKGFKHTESDHSLFVNRKTRVIASVYVDDIQIYGPKGSKHVTALKEDLHKRFAMTDLGASMAYLGMEIQRNRLRRTVRVTQTAYLRKVLSRFGMTACASAPTPMVAGTQLEEEVVDKATTAVTREYQSMVGSLMYPMIQTRPDICYAVTILSRYNHNPNAKHIAAVKRVIRYLKGTLNYGITYGTDSTLTGYTDADWAADTKTRRSLRAYVFLLYGGAVS